MKLNLIQQDLKHVWHPCTRMKDLERYPPLIIQKAKDSYLYTDRGPIIDAISSWWCKSLGHGHLQVINAIKEQLDSFEHIIGADTTYPALIELASLLAELSGLQHVFFASDGSSAVEIAMKLALQGAQIQGYTTRKQFVALRNAYHGETLATLSVSDLGLYKEPFKDFGLPCHFLDPIPYINNEDNPLWKNCAQEWVEIEKQLNNIKENVCAIIFEPIVQGAGGMRCYSADFLRRLAAWAKANHVYLIADEIMTGLGRTGKWFACEHADIKPDMLCLSKGLTSGAMALSCVLIDNPIFNLFYHDRPDGPSFLHSHTYSGNPLAVSAALATIKTMHTEDILNKAKKLGDCMKHHFAEVANKTGKLSNVRSIGALIAGDLEAVDPSRRYGYEVQQEALCRGALLRPLGNTLYWLPPLTTDHSTIEKLKDITYHSIEAVYSKGA